MKENGNGSKKLFSNSWVKVGAIVIGVLLINLIVWNAVGTYIATNNLLNRMSNRGDSVDIVSNTEVMESNNSQSISKELDNG